MRRIAALAAAVLFALPLHAQPARWRTFESPSGGFRILFPAEPAVRHGTRRTELGDVQTSRYSAADRAGATYNVTFSDYPPAGIAKASAEKLLDASRDGLVYLSRGKLISEKPSPLGKFAGREQEIEGADGTRYFIRLLLVGNRLYQLAAVARPPDTAEAQKFFGSFVLTGAARP